MLQLIDKSIKPDMLGCLIWLLIVIQFPESFWQRTMKVPVALSFLSFAQIFVKSHIGLVEQESYAMSYAVQSVVAKCFMAKFSNLRIISSYEENMKGKIYDFVSEMVELLQPDIKITLEEPKIVLQSSKRRGSPVMIIVHSQKSFDLIKNTFGFNNMRFRKFILLVLVDGFFSSPEQISKAFWDHRIHNVNVLSVEVNGSIGLYTFYPFGENHCGDNKKLILINSFESFEWSTGVFYGEKFRNLNKCDLKIATLATSIPSVITTVDKNGVQAFSGLEIELAQHIATEYNLTAVFDPIQDVGSIFLNGSSTSGVLAAVLGRTHDVALGTLSLQYERVQFLTETFPVLSVPIIVVIPPTQLISPVKKLTRPFSFLVWFSMILTFCLAVLVIVVAKLMSKSAYKFIVGDNIKYPVINITIAFLGGSQNKLPGTNFARCLLMKFLLFCLVIRSMYQGKLFIMLQLELREDQVETVDDIIAKNMTFYAYESFA